MEGLKDLYFLFVLHLPNLFHGSAVYLFPERKYLQPCTVKAFIHFLQAIDSMHCHCKVRLCSVRFVASSYLVLKASSIGFWQFCSQDKIAAVISCSKPAPLGFGSFVARIKLQQFSRAQSKSLAGQEMAATVISEM